MAQIKVNMTYGATGTLPAVSGANLTNLDARDLENALPAISGASLTGISGGKLLQVINAVSSAESVITSNTFTDSGLTASITPASTSSKILIFANCTGIGKAGNDTYGKFKLLRGSTDIVANFEERGGKDATSGDNKVGGVSVNYLDSPSTTSSTTYKVQLMSGNNNSYAQMGNSSSKSSITLMEIAA